MKPDPHTIALCHPRDLAWLEAGARGDLGEAARLREIRGQLAALPRPEMPPELAAGYLNAFAGVNRGGSDSWQDSGAVSRATFMSERPAHGLRDEFSPGNSLDLARARDPLSDRGE